MAAVSEADLKAVVKSLVEAATGGNVQAAALLLDRCCGRVRQDNSDNDNDVEYRIIGPKINA